MSDPEPSSTIPTGVRASIDVPALPRVGFTDLGRMAGEPASDVMIRTATGTDLRERVVEVAADAETTLSAGAAPTVRTVVISNALLDASGAVVLDEAGRPRLASRHEVVLTNEAMGRLGSVAALDTALRDAREVAAALAELEFRGAALGDDILGGRLRPNQS